MTEQKEALVDRCISAALKAGPVSDFGDQVELSDFDVGQQETLRRWFAAAIDEIAALQPPVAVPGELVEAIRDLLGHRVGDLPSRGWLRDNDRSRAAIANLARVFDTLTSTPVDETKL